jgi:hypothetical protein
MSANLCLIFTGESITVDYVDKSFVIDVHPLWFLDNGLGTWRTFVSVIFA